MTVLETITTEDMLIELSHRFPNAVLAYDREATPQGDRTYLTRIVGEPFRCYFLAGRLFHQMNLAVDIGECPDANL